MNVQRQVLLVFVLSNLAFWYVWPNVVMRLIMCSTIILFIVAYVAHDSFQRRPDSDFRNIGFHFLAIPCLLLGLRGIWKIAQEILYPVIEMIAVGKTQSLWLDADSFWGLAMGCLGLLLWRTARVRKAK